jgi:drug/metabolite transporter (DMT)-like permease
MTLRKSKGSDPAHAGQTPFVLLDLLLLLVVLTWGANYSALKRAFDEVPPQAFNAMRIALASVLYLIAIFTLRRRARRGKAVASVFYTPHDLTRRDRWQLLGLGLVGHLCYQMCFAAGVDRTTASNAALIIGSTPALVAVASALLGRDRVTPFHWIGAAVSAAGIYVVVGSGASLGGATWHGDVLVMVSVCCWAVYTIFSVDLMKRHSPLYVTGMTMAIGGWLYAAVMLPSVIRVDWWDLSVYTLCVLPLSAIFALCLSYLIWYAGVQRLGPARTSIYSNIVPVAGMLVAWAWLGEPITNTKMAGAAAIITGVLLTRLGRRSAILPAEE